MTTNPYAELTAQQIINAFPHNEAPRFLIRDRDGIYGDYFKKRVEDMGIEEVPIVPRSPWQNPYCERVKSGRAGGRIAPTRRPALCG
ncbi:MAG: hypothetical protein ABSF26_30045 [Thermoguttaceae bacterium]